MPDEWKYEWLMFSKNYAETLENTPIWVCTLNEAE
jgi:hypothetical protein